MLLQSEFDHLISTKPRLYSPQYGRSGSFRFPYKRFSRSSWTLQPTSDLMALHGLLDRLFKSDLESAFPGRFRSMRDGRIIHVSWI